MRARETLTFTGETELESAFEIAMPGEHFAPYTHERLIRIADKKA
jgi:hypothetical protein